MTSEPGVPEALPLGAAQEGIWTGQEYDRESPAFNTAEYVEIRGPIDVTLLETAIRRAVAETDAVNVVFDADDEGHAWQRFRSQRVSGASGASQTSTVPWPLHVLDVHAEADPLAAATAWMRADLSVPIDLRRDRLFCHAIFVM